VLLDPRFKDIYETETLRFWLNETFRGNYRSIATIQQQLTAYVKDRKNKKKLVQHVATMSLASDSGHLPPTHIAIGAAQPILPNHEIFYKAQSVNEMSENHMIVTEDGSINMRAISTYRGGDLNPVDHAWYWTPEYETAVKYRDWAVHRVRLGEVVIIRIQVPGSFLQTLRQEELWFSASWKEYIWACKKQLLPKASWYLRFCLSSFNTNWT